MCIHFKLVDPTCHASNANFSLNGCLGKPSGRRRGVTMSLGHYVIGPLPARTSARPY